MPVIKIRPRDKLAERFKKKVTEAAPDYEFGVKNPKKGWLEQFLDAADVIAEALRKVAELQLFAKGAERVGQRKWSENTGRKGPVRWKDETPKSADAWKAGFEPFASALDGFVLEKKRPKGDPYNIDVRVKPVVSALVNKKLELRGIKSS